MSGARALLALVAIAATAAGLLAGMDQLTRTRIADNEARKLLATLATVLPPSGYDNEPHLDWAWVPDPAALGSADALPVYRARLAGEPAVLVLSVVSPDGYVDRIRLLVGIDTAGRISGVRAVSHAETPGLGDGIQTDVSDWILGFDGRTLNDPASSWVLRRDGGEFDQLTGATITSRAVVNAVRAALTYAQANSPKLFTLAPVTEAVE
ncbi:MAG: electron transport complex subunit RsxG [Gammaproteobacteria bacterium]